MAFLQNLKIGLNPFQKHIIQLYWGPLYNGSRAVAIPIPNTSNNPSSIDLTKVIKGVSNAATTAGKLASRSASAIAAILTPTNTNAGERAWQRQQRNITPRKFGERTMDERPIGSTMTDETGLKWIKTEEGWEQISSSIPGGTPNNDKDPDEKDPKKNIPWKTIAKYTGLGLGIGGLGYIGYLLGTNSNNQSGNSNLSYPEVNIGTTDPDDPWYIASGDTGKYEKLEFDSNIINNSNGTWTEGFDDDEPQYRK